MPPFATWARTDPRLFQIASLTGLLAWGMADLGFDVSPGRVILTLGTTLATQLACTRLLGLARFDPKSALISGLSLCLLLRTNEPFWVVFAGVLAIASKFLIRIQDKHLFNPTNLGLVAVLLLTDEAWVSPGQWGSTAIGAFCAVSAGMLVTRRASRDDVTWAFLSFWALLLFSRSWSLGEPWTIPLHRLQSGALLLFAFFMISDPKTTPDSRAGRILYALAVALGAYWVQFRLFHTNGLLWSLAAVSPLVRLVDRFLPGHRYVWPAARALFVPSRKEIRMRSRWAVSVLASGAIALAALAWSSPAQAFCGFYVARADTKLYNRSSQVALVRDGDRTVLTMAADFRGEPKEFALVVPVPTFLTRQQIHVAERALLEHLDAYTAPRLVEYFDPDPCVPQMLGAAKSRLAQADEVARKDIDRARSLGVRIEARYTVGEYDILILSAEESSGLERWLRESGYRIPRGASEVLGSYLRQGMKFFVAKVNLAEQAKLGFTYLRPLQVAYESPKFMLPIRLGTVNADGAQELFVYALTRTGRVETVNYRTVRLPSDVEIPPYVKEEFGAFYRAMFERSVERENREAVFLEYAWDMGWCDPCAADPLSPVELRNLGVFWNGSDDASRDPAGAQNVFVTRLHVRYDGAHFPEDLVFQETGDRSNFQGRYILRHPWSGDHACSAAGAYQRELRERREREAATLASLTGWNLATIRDRVGLGAETNPPSGLRQWWEDLWKD